MVPRQSEKQFIHLRRNANEISALTSYTIATCSYEVLFHIFEL